MAQNMCVVYSGAIVGVSLLALGIVRGVLWRREIVFFTVMLLLATLYALGWYTPAFRVFYEFVPAVHLFRRPADAIFLMGAMLAIVGGYLVHVAATDGTQTSWREARGAKSLLTAVFVCAVLIAIWKGHLRDAALPLLVSAGLVAAALSLLSVLPRVSTATAVALVALLSTVDLAYYNGPNGATGLRPAQFAMLARPGDEPTVEFLRSRLDAEKDPARRDRVELLGLGFEWPNASLVHDFEHSLGYNPLRLSAYAEGVGAEDTIALPEQRRFTRLFPGYDCLLARLVGLRYVASRVPLEQVDPTLRGDSIRLVETTASARIYELPEPYPRVMLVTHAQPADFARILRTGRWPSFDPRQTVLIAADEIMVTPEPASLGSPRPARVEKAPPARPGTIRIVRYENTVVEIEAVGEHDGYVVLNDSWHPWWRATVDGKATPVLKANVLFRAVPVPAGRHVVRFAFEPVTGSVGELVEAVRARVPLPHPKSGPVATAGSGPAGSTHAEPRTQ